MLDDIKSSRRRDVSSSSPNPPLWTEDRCREADAAADADVAVPPAAAAAALAALDAAVRPCPPPTLTSRRAKVSPQERVAVVLVADTTSTSRQEAGDNGGRRTRKQPREGLGTSRNSVAKRRASNMTTPTTRDESIETSQTTDKRKKIE